MNEMILDGEHVVPPQEHRKFNVEAPITERSLDELKSPLSISLSVFDPRKGRAVDLRMRDTYALTGRKRRKAWGRSSK